jgi:hypothetical protein
MTPGAIENLAQGTFARGTKTFGAALLLCGGHGGTWHGKRMDQLVREVEQRWEESYKTGSFPRYSLIGDRAVADK